MFAGQLDTPEPSVRLVRPVVERDASLSLQWLGGEHGRTTMLIMGVPADLIEAPILDHEKSRISSFINLAGLHAKRPADNARPAAGQLVIEGRFEVPARRSWRDRPGRMPGTQPAAL